MPTTSAARAAERDLIDNDFSSLEEDLQVEEHWRRSWLKEAPASLASRIPTSVFLLGNFESVSRAPATSIQSVSPRPERLR